MGLKRIGLNSHGTKKIGAYSSSSRNYDLTMQFCHTSLRQRGQRSVALNHYVVARRASTNHGTHYSAVKSNQVKSCLRWKYTAIEHISINKP